MVSITTNEKYPANLNMCEFYHVQTGSFSGQANRWPFRRCRSVLALDLDRPPCLPKIGRPLTLAIGRRRPLLRLQLRPVSSGEEAPTTGVEADSICICQPRTGAGQCTVSMAL